MTPQVRPSDSIRHLVRLMNLKDGTLSGIAVVIDDVQKVVGVVNHGDIIRAVGGEFDLDDDVSKIMTTDPVLISSSISQDRIVDEVRRQLLTKTGGTKELTRYIPTIDENGILIDVLDLFPLLTRSWRQYNKVEIYGLGFVGLTLSVALASRGHYVTGIDVNPDLVCSLNSGKPHVLEPRLADMLRQVLELGKISFRQSPCPDSHSQVYIVAVGTPIDNRGGVDLAALTSVCRTVSKRIRVGDLVMLRSTVPVGTTAEQVRHILESNSGMVAGKDFCLAFTPERTVEGSAMSELSTLPQIVGGLTRTCCDQASAFWQTLTDSVVSVESLEAAELVKLINNSYRDLSFAFANGLALLADHFNLDANRIIAAANEGYPRNPIPRPSPGVGGYCLTKDPFLYGVTGKSSVHRYLSVSGRDVNRKAGEYPISVTARFADRLAKHISELKVFIVGIAFKGVPETNDCRGSVALTIADTLAQAGCQVYGYDSVLSAETIKSHGLINCDIHSGATMCDVVLILNNHPKNVPAGLVGCLRGRETLLFDGWSMLNRNEVEQFSEITYATMGYMTPERSV